MAGRARVNVNRVTAPELEQFIVTTVQLTGHVLGAGAYGSVEEVEIPGATVAAKKLHETLVNLGSPQQVEKWVRDFVEECKLMSQLRHPHIVQFLGVCYLPGAPLPVLLMEKLLTSLDNLLETSPNIPIHVKVHLLVGTSRGLVYLHDRTPPIAHRDLSAKNILVNSGLNAKIADLGVSRIVNVQPGQLAATMTQMPGTGVYMPPEAAEEEEATRYNTGIDIFSVGVVSLFTFTQTFPKDLKPHNYRDPVTRRLVARSEIERREDYIVVMKGTLGETHPLVELTLECLEYDQEDRPSAVVVLRRLEEVRTTLPQICTQTKLQLIQQIESKDGEIVEIRQEKVELRTANEHLQGQIVQVRQEKVELQAANDHLHEQIVQIRQEKVELRAANDHLQGQIVQKDANDHLQGQIVQKDANKLLQEEIVQTKQEKVKLREANDHLQGQIVQKDADDQTKLEKVEFRAANDHLQGQIVANDHLQGQIVQKDANKLLLEEIVQTKQEKVKLREANDHLQEIVQKDADDQTKQEKVEFRAANDHLQGQIVQKDANKLLLEEIVQEKVKLREANDHLQGQIVQKDADDHIVQTKQEKVEFRAANDHLQVKKDANDHLQGQIVQKGANELEGQIAQTKQEKVEVRAAKDNLQGQIVQKDANEYLLRQIVQNDLQIGQLQSANDHLQAEKQKEDPEESDDECFDVYNDDNYELEEDIDDEDLIYGAGDDPFDGDEEFDDFDY